ncbi:hypothetical protein T4B_5386, partial [Trichinella pseudospiralis]
LRTTNSHTVKVILLPPPASDFGSEDLDIEVIPENPEEGSTSIPCRDAPRWKNTAMFNFPPSKKRYRPMILENCPRFVDDCLTPASRSRMPFKAIKDGIKGHPRWPSGVAQSLAYDESLSN